MKNSNFLIPDEIPEYKNDIYLDDIPVESLLYRNVVPAYPTPADITWLWANGFDLTEKMKKVLITILLNDISITASLNRITEAESILKEELEKVKDDPAEQLKLSDTLQKLKELIDQDNYNSSDPDNLDPYGNPQRDE
jgi:hypothetical protein